MREWGTRRESDRSRSGRGHSLIELLIATALGILVVGAAALLYRSQRETSSLLADAASMRDAGMTALLLIGQQIEMAGFVPPDRSKNDADRFDHVGIGPAIFGCGSGPGPAVSGADRSACPFVSGGSDIVTVSYVDDGVSTWPSAAREATDCLGQRVGEAGERVVIVNRFFVELDDAGASQLYCHGNGGNKQPVVAGIERLSVRYWLHGAIAPVEAQSVAAGGWSDVVAVDLCVLVRGARVAAGHRYVSCDGTSVASIDARARQTVSRRVVVRNNGRAR
ncbi:MAG: type pilus assembly protein PilW [Paraburkholderia sp.]|nr:type pilus assembly protein PilW [Paraburkholderia sp.]